MCSQGCVCRRHISFLESSSHAVHPERVRDKPSGSENLLQEYCDKARKDQVVRLCAIALALVAAQQAKLPINSAEHGESNGDVLYLYRDIHNDLITIYGLKDDGSDYTDCCAFQSAVTRCRSMAQCASSYRYCAPTSRSYVKVYQRSTVSRDRITRVTACFVLMRARERMEP